MFQTAVLRRSGLARSDDVFCCWRGGSMIVVMLDANGDPIKRQVTCPDCISVLALGDASTGAVVLQNTHAQVHQYWTNQAQRASVVFDGFQQRGPPIHS